MNNTPDSKKSAQSLSVDTAQDVSAKSVESKVSEPVSKASGPAADKNPRCVEIVHNGGRTVSFHPCERHGAVVRDGKWYCKQHDPVAVRQRRDVADAKFRAEYAASERASRRQQLLLKLADGITLEQLEAGVVRVVVDP